MGSSRGLTIGLAVSLVLALAGISHALPITGLVAHYAFDGDARDGTAAGNHGTVHGATLTEDRFGNSGRAYGFDGNDYISFGSMSPLGRHTLSVWIRPLAHSERGTIVGQESGPSQACGKGFVLRMTGSERPYYLLDPAGCGGGGSTIILGDVVADPAPWMHLAGTFDGSTMSLYVDGLLVEQRSGARFDASNWLSVGATTFFNGQQTYYRGAMDEIRIYDRALSAAEVLELAGGTTTGSVPEPSTLLLVAAGFAGMLLARRRRSP